MIKSATASTPKEVRWNILLLRSFQMFHQKYNKSPSNLTFCFLSKERRIRLHQELIACEDDICRSGLPICDIRSIRTFWVNGQWRHKCAGVSGAALHSWHIGSCGHLRLARLLAVRILCCSRIQAKIRHLGSACAFQIGVRAGFFVVPWIVSDKHFA
jgi:hypothetical protein